jgi:hypothetical protein
MRRLRPRKPGALKILLKPPVRMIIFHSHPVIIQNPVGVIPVLGASIYRFSVHKI